MDARILERIGSSWRMEGFGEQPTRHYQSGTVVPNATELMQCTVGPDRDLRRYFFIRRNGTGDPASSVKKLYPSRSRQWLRRQPLRSSLQGQGPPPRPDQQLSAFARICAGAAGGGRGGGGGAAAGARGRPRAQ